jgi:hypothetical protein
MAGEWKWAGPVVGALWALGALGAGYRLIASPPALKLLMPGCPRAADASACVATLTADTTAPATTLFVLAGIMVIALVLGPNLRLIKAPGIEVSTHDPVAPKAEVEAVVASLPTAPSSPTEAAAQALTDADDPKETSPLPRQRHTDRDGIHYGVYKLSEVPIQITAALVATLAKEESPPEGLDVSFVLRRFGGTNNAWTFILGGGVGWRVSMGGRGRGEPTVTRLGSR